MQLNNTDQNNMFPSVKPPVLDRRLSMVSKLIPNGCTPADVGTDHAYLPCYLVTTGRIRSAIASDVAPGPLRNAINTIDRYGLSDRIRCVLSDGTQSLGSSDYDTLICAGMGGELIVSILRDTKGLRGKRLILQPMTHSEDLRAFLCRNGFTIRKELSVNTGGKNYIAFSAEFTNDYDLSDDAFYHYFGGYPSYADEASRLFVEKQTDRLRKRLSGLRTTATANGKELELLTRILNDPRLEEQL